METNQEKILWEALDLVESRGMGVQAEQLRRLVLQERYSIRGDGTFQPTERARDRFPKFLVLVTCWIADPLPKLPRLEVKVDSDPNHPDVAAVHMSAARWGEIRGVCDHIPFAIPGRVVDEVLVGRLDRMHGELVDQYRRASRESEPTWLGA